VRVIARTGRNTGISVGPVGLFVLAIGWLFLALLVAVGFVVTCLGIAAAWGLDEVRRRRRRPKPTTPHVAPGVEPWARGHREVTATERAIMAQRR
jgi:hypothetical protein